MNHATLTAYHTGDGWIADYKHVSSSDSVKAVMHDEAATAFLKCELNWLSLMTQQNYFYCLSLLKQKNLAPSWQLHAACSSVHLHPCVFSINTNMQVTKCLLVCVHASRCSYILVSNPMSPAQMKSNVSSAQSLENKLRQKRHGNVIYSTLFVRCRHRVKCIRETKFRNTRAIWLSARQNTVNQTHRRTNWQSCRQLIKCSQQWTDPKKQKAGLVIRTQA